MGSVVFESIKDKLLSRPALAHIKKTQNLIAVPPTGSNCEYKPSRTHSTHEKKVQLFRLLLNIFSDILTQYKDIDIYYKQVFTINVILQICTTYSLSKRNIDKLVLSRNKLLKTKHFHSLDDIEKYSEDSVSAIYFLLLGVVGVKNVHADHVSSHLGKAQGITNVLRQVLK